MKANEELKAPQPRMIDLRLGICEHEVTKTAEKKLHESTLLNRQKMQLRDRFSAIINLLDEVAKGISSFDETASAEKSPGKLHYNDETWLRAYVRHVEEQWSIVIGFDLALGEIRDAGRALVPPRTVKAKGSVTTRDRNALRRDDISPEEESILPALPKFLTAVDAQKARVQKLRAALESAVLVTKVQK